MFQIILKKITHYFYILLFPFLVQRGGKVNSVDTSTFESQTVNILCIFTHLGSENTFK